MLIAHLTDIHVADPRDYDGAWPAKVRKHSEELLAALLRDMRAIGPDHVVLTGDLTQTARREEFERARAHLDANLPGIRVTVLPGNHDRWSPESVAFFEERFGDLLRCDLGGGSGFPFCHLAGNVALLGIDSSPFVPGVDPADVKGFVSREQLERLQELARDPRLAGRFLILLLHHHLRLSDEDSRADDPKDPTPLINASQVEQALEKAGVQLVLHGHRHKQMRLDLEWGGQRIPVLCPGSATRVDERPDRTGRYNLYRIDGGSLVEVRTRAWHAERSAFDWV